MEKWLPISGYEGLYEASNHGRIRSLVRNVVRTDHYHGKYRWICLSKEGVKKQHDVHRIVAITFLGEPPSPRHQVNHIDGNRQNNHADNLEWVTPSRNSRHAFEKGLRGVNRHKGKLDQQKAREIRSLRGNPTKHIAIYFSVSESTVLRVLQGKIWKEGF